MEGSVVGTGRSWEQAAMATSAVPAESVAEIVLCIPDFLFAFMKGGQGKSRLPAPSRIHKQRVLRFAECGYPGASPSRRVKLRGKSRR
jgi:hypothetical protein